MLNAILIRHGSTELNEQSRYQGWTDAPLSAKGLNEAKVLASRLASDHFTAIYSSDLIRCVQTTNIVFPNASYTTFASLREISFGDWDCLTYEECLHRDLARYSQWLTDPSSVTPPNGESLTAFSDRIHAIINKIIALHQNTVGSATDSKVAIVTHGGPIRTLIQHYLFPSVPVTQIPSIPPCDYAQIAIAP